MNVSQIMTTQVRAIAPDRSIREAARLMDELNVGLLPVCEGAKLVGVITDRDITVRATAAGAVPDTTPVFTAMTGEPRTCRPGDDVSELVETMKRLQIRRIPVLSDAGSLVGIVSLGDVAEEAVPGAEALLRTISTPSEPDLSGAAGGRPRAAEGADPLTPEERAELARRLRRADEQPQGERASRFDDLAAPGLADPGRDVGIDRDEDLVRAAFGSAADGDTGSGEGSGKPFFHDDGPASSAAAAGYGDEDAADSGIRTVEPRVRHVRPPAESENPAGGLQPPQPVPPPDER